MDQGLKQGEPQKLPEFMDDIINADVAGAAALRKGDTVEMEGKTWRVTENTGVVALKAIDGSGTRNLTPEQLAAFLAREAEVARQKQAAEQERASVQKRLDDALEEIEALKAEIESLNNEVQHADQKLYEFERQIPVVRRVQSMTIKTDNVLLNPLDSEIERMTGEGWHVAFENVVQTVQSGITSIGMVVRFERTIDSPSRVPWLRDATVSLAAEYVAKFDEEQPQAVMVHEGRRPSLYGERATTEELDIMAIRAAEQAMRKRLEEAGPNWGLPSLDED